MKERCLSGSLAHVDFKSQGDFYFSFVLNLKTHVDILICYVMKKITSFRVGLDLDWIVINFICF